ncbi:nectin-1 isoform X3 [Anolis carolinensis]|uniref:nectin-1 isoform X3 n=1 Tax=Anolis carolinensis TaxID=28377 RepID=UPI0007DB87DF|nr:PREDICTED: nectin-1 isoform X3 [Anolis carolinensis]|eukprot:XP_016850198.1 PREDICTED: nectin-1 isoform X3 [Anolis carolinensis]
MAAEASPGWLRSWWATGLCLAALGPFPGLWAQMVLVNDTVSGFIGTSVILHCSMTNPSPNVKITQVTWQKATNGSKQNVAIYNPNMGVSVLQPYKERVTFRDPSTKDGTIQLSRLELEDEGVYICEFATFPTGNRENQLNLTVLAKPTNRMERTTRPLIARSGMTEKIVVATCTSSNGKPPSTVTWDTKLKGEAEFQEIRNNNGTITVTSRYRLLPSREAHRQQLMCVVNYQLDRFTDSMTLNVLYEPEVRIDGFDGNWYLNRKDVKLTCISDANPPATQYQWKLMNGSLPDNVEVQNSTLFFKGPVTYSLAGTYVCEASNTIGTRSGLVEVNVTEKPLPQAGAGGILGILGMVIAAVLIVGVATIVFVVYRRQQKSRTEADHDMMDLPPSHKPAPPPPKRKQDMKSHLTAEDIQVVHLDNMKEPEEEIQKLPPQPPYYDMAATEPSPQSDKMNFRNCHSEIPDAGDYLTCRYSREDQYLTKIPYVYSPLSYLPEGAHPSNHTSTSFCCPPPGSRAPYICPKEQYV